MEFMLTGASCGKVMGVWDVSIVLVPVAADWEVAWEVACDALDCDET